MATASPSSFQNTADPDIQPLASRTIVQSEDWTVAEYLCTQGPQDKATEELHHGFSMAAVLQGSFRYRSERSTSLMIPGSFLLGNHGACFECGHEHSRGDRCIAVHLTPHFFSEIAASSAGSNRYRFDRGMLPQQQRLIATLARIESGLAWSTPLGAEESIVSMTEAILLCLSGHRPSIHPLKAREARRMSEAAEYINHYSREDLRLDTLAVVAGMSKYHFLRSFRKTFQITPHRYLLSVRMRRVAQRLLKSTAPVTDIALGEGFGDLSSFNAHFRAHFGMAPRRFRESKPGIAST